MIQLCCTLSGNSIANFDTKTSIRFPFFEKIFNTLCREIQGKTLDKTRSFHYNRQAIGVWRSLVSRLVRDQEASGSNPDTPTKKQGSIHRIDPCFLCHGLCGGIRKAAPSSMQAPYPSCPRKREPSSIPLHLFSPQNLRFCGDPRTASGGLSHPVATAALSARLRRLPIALLLPLLFARCIRRRRRSQTSPPWENPDISVHSKAVHRIDPCFLCHGLCGKQTLQLDHRGILLDQRHIGKLCSVTFHVPVTFAADAADILFVDGDVIDKALFCRFVQKFPGLGV